jgi:hypothetical protein
MWDRPRALAKRRGRSRPDKLRRRCPAWAIGLLCLAACGDGDRALDESAVVGVYDTTVVHVDGEVYEGVARIDREDDGTLEIFLPLGLNEDIFTDESLELDLGPLAAGTRMVRGFFLTGDLGFREEPERVFLPIEGDLGPTLTGSEGAGRAILGGITPALDIGGWTATRLE